ncbi:hypothetical protein LCGC14_1798600 [marine sediment metagenome]|uniref:HNH nuclease domain-containing protein n=1 Tax=marine sediment metagenome TaxID=412755 RepID=A0A0F9HCZ9_9ZZZZ
MISESGLSLKVMVAEIAAEMTSDPKLVKALSNRCPFCRSKIKWGGHQRCIKKFWWFQGRADQRLANPELRRYILGRDNWHCRYCGKPVKMDTAHIDHLLPWSRSGQTLPQNLVSSCRRCNVRKGAIMPSKGDLPCMLIRNQPLVERFDRWKSGEMARQERRRA